MCIQAAVLFVISAGVGVGLNTFSSEPLPWVREPMTFEDERWTLVDADTVLEHINNGTAMLIDARSESVHKEAHILGSINIPEENLPDSLMEYQEFLPRDLLMIVYCGGGNCDQSVTVLEMMDGLGFEKLGLYKEGWEDWQAKEFPTDSLQ